MRVIFKTVWFLIMIVFISLSAFQSVISQTNQSQVIRGSITDNETGETLPGVHVYISETTIGTVTKENGTFELKHTFKGRFKLVASFVGYSTQLKEIGLNRDSEAIEVNFELSPVSAEMEELEVQASNSEWQNHFNEFRQYFLGASRFANKTIIENSWSIDFEIDDENNLIAKAPEPIVVTNYALGYEIEIDLVEFKWNRNRDSGLYVIYTRFNDLKPEDSDQHKDWMSNRISAYRGSFEHFLKSLYNDELTSNRFEPVIKNSDNRIQISEVVHNSSGGMVIHTNTPGISSENSKTFRLRGPIDVLYGRNTGYNTTDNRTRSALIPMNRGGVFVVTEQGRLVNPASLQLVGEWARDRIAVLMPVTYSLDD